VLYHNSDDANRQTTLYLKSIKTIKKGRGKKADGAHEDLAARLTDPEQVRLRRLWWGRQTWERLLEDLQEASIVGDSSLGDLLGAYRRAWADTQVDWGRWHEHFRRLRSELGNWLLEAGQQPISVDLGAKKPSKEIESAEKEFERYLRSGDLPEELLLRSRLAWILDYTLMFDVEWGAVFENQVSPEVVTWPWAQRWPHEFEGMGGWRIRSGEPLLGTVVRLMDGRGTIRTGQRLSGEASAPGALMQTFLDTQVIVCDDSLLVLQWRRLTGSQGAWATVDAFAYRQVDVHRKGRIDVVEVTDPGTGESVAWFSVEHLRKPVLDALLDAKGRADRHGESAGTVPIV